MKKNLPLIFRIIVFVLFVLSGISKMFPLWQFEKQLVDLQITDWCGAHYLSRLIIGFELAIGFAILQPHFLKRLVIPATIILLVAFCVHLGIQMWEHGPMNGNCGCFGQLIPMTPLEAFVKNILTIAMLIYLYKHLEELPRGENKLINLIAIYSLSTLILFVFYPFAPCGSSEAKPAFTSSFQLDSAAVQDIDSAAIVAAPAPIVETIKNDSVKHNTPITKPEDKQPKPVTSVFGSHSDFNGKSVNLDAGKKIVCMFAPGCDHCQAAAKEIGVLAKNKDFPPVYIYFMDEESELIPEFFNKAQTKFPFKVLSIPDFWNMIGANRSTPGVFYQWNGNSMKVFDGIEKNKFVAEQLKQAVDKKY